MSETEQSEIKNWGQFLVEGSKIVLNKAESFAKETVKKHPEFVAGATLIALSLVLPATEAYLAHGVIELYKAGVPANPPSDPEAIKTIVGIIGWNTVNIFCVFNEGLKKVSNLDMLADKTK